MPIYEMPNRKQRRGKKFRANRSGDSPLEDFFAQFPHFDYDSTQSASLEFYRLCDESGWSGDRGRDNAERARAHSEFKDALVQQFNNVYGTDEDSLSAWQDLCCIVQIDPIPDDLEACREAVRGTYVNIVDLVDIETTDGEVEIFNTEQELSEYTKATGKFFPKENAYAGGLLRYLLRHILSPAPAVHSRRRKGRR